MRGIRMAERASRLPDVGSGSAREHRVSRAGFKSVHGIKPPRLVLRTQPRSPGSGLPGCEQRALPGNGSCSQCSIERRALPAFCRQSTQHCRRDAGTTYADRLVVAAAPLPAGRSERKKGPCMKPTPDPSLEGSRHSAAPFQFPSREGLGLGSWSVGRPWAPATPDEARSNRSEKALALSHWGFVVGLESEPPHVGRCCGSSGSTETIACSGWPPGHPLHLRTLLWC